MWLRDSWVVCMLKRGPERYRRVWDTRCAEPDDRLET
jgi:hypothetical protein